MPGQEGKTFRKPHAYYHDVSWDAQKKDRPVWSQAFSSDNGKPALSYNHEWQADISDSVVRYMGRLLLCPQKLSKKKPVMQ